MCNVQYSMSFFLESLIVDELGALRRKAKRELSESKIKGSLKKASGVHDIPPSIDTNIILV